MTHQDTVLIWSLKQEIDFNHSICHILHQCMPSQQLFRPSKTFRVDANFLFWVVFQSNMKITTRAQIAVDVNLSAVWWGLSQFFTRLSSSYQSYCIPSNMWHETPQKCIFQLWTHTVCVCVQIKCEDRGWQSKHLMQLRHLHCSWFPLIKRTWPPGAKMKCHSFSCLDIIEKNDHVPGPQ